ncbi:MAG TPA: pirin family protein [Desertimonas sp.]|nr:pirin family protein [Desertimonas sp.]
MSGPLRIDDFAESVQRSPPAEHLVELTPSRDSRVGETTVRRALPTRQRRTVGAWCFLDHAPERLVEGGPGLNIGPHPHIGLQTVTWLLDGEVVHRDSLGSEQLITPGQLNQMSAGRGVVHAEETPRRYRGTLHGVQLWVAQPERTRHDVAAFEHHAELPSVDLPTATVTVMVGALMGVESPARRDTDLVGIDVALRPGRTVLPVEPSYEHAIVVLAGTAAIDDRVVPADQLGYLGSGRADIAITVTTPTRALVVGGEPFEAQPLMWWNFVARDRDEIDAAYEDWQSGSERFGTVTSSLDLVPAPPPLWRSSGRPFRRR